MLKDIIPAKYRKAVYAAVTLAAVVFGAWQASAGNWQVFVGSLITAATTGLATANTAPSNGDDGVLEMGFVIGILFATFLILAILWLVGVHVHVR